MKKFFDVFFGIIIVSVGLLAVTTLMSLYGVPNTARVFVVESGSMAPAIPAGSVVIATTNPNNFEKIKEGDVITYIDKGRNNQIVTHRVAEETELGYVTKGDANASADSNPVAESEIIGKLLFSVPYLGWAVAFAKTPLGYFFLILLPATIFILSEVNILREELSKLFQRKPETLTQ